MQSTTVASRNHFGKAARILRRQSIIPANIYSKKNESVPVQLPELQFKKLFSEAGRTSVVELQIEGSKKKHPVLISEVQYHYNTGRVIHVDFREINLKEKITIAVPIEFVGESQAVTDGAMLIPLLDEIQVEALPQDMPENFQADLSKLASAGDELTVADLNIDTTKHHIELASDMLIARVEVSQMAEELETVEEVEILSEKSSDSESTQSSGSTEDTKASEE